MTIGNGRRTRIFAVLATTGLVVALAGCSGSATEAFCERVAVAHEVGPLFPARTDGEPVANLDALDALEQLAAAAPDEIDDEAGVLVDEARALVAEARARRENSFTSPDSDRWSRRAVEQAQSAVFEYAATQCDIDLTETAHTGRGPRTSTTARLSS
ncbi:MAG: hypothetical protein ACLFWR_01845 [Acidimicrobiales bacterium]